MNPIALKHGRTVYAYACGRCHTFGDKSSACMGYWRKGKADHIADGARLSRYAAERCCLCHACKAPLPDGVRFGDCAACKVRNEAKHREDIAKAEARVAALDARNDDAIARSGGDPKAAAELLEEMLDASETYYHGGWVIGLEYLLWSGAHDPGDIPADIARRLRVLSERAGGWWRWSMEFDDPVFVPMAEWLVLAAKPPHARV